MVTPQPKIRLLLGSHLLKGNTQRIFQEQSLAFHSCIVVGKHGVFCSLNWCFVKTYSPLKITIPKDVKLVSAFDLLSPWGSSDHSLGINGQFQPPRSKPVYWVPSREAGGTRHRSNPVKVSGWILHHQQVFILFYSFTCSPFLKCSTSTSHSLTVWPLMFG